MLRYRIIFLSQTVILSELVPYALDLKKITWEFWKLSESDVIS